MLRRSFRPFSDFKVLQDRGSFKIYEVPKHVCKPKIMETTEAASNPVPVSAAMRPYTLKNPKLGDKKYFWCSCGLSKRQPFCDKSHHKTAFKPLPFVIEQQVSEVHLCLCKLTTQPPYCDGVKCKQTA